MSDGKAWGRDAPLRDIDDADHYELGRVAYHLARMVAGFDSRGEVIAVNAPWGGGKTSLVNLTESFFLDDADPKAVGSDAGAMKLFVPRRCPRDEFTKTVLSCRTRNVKFVRFNAWYEGDSSDTALAIIDAIDDTLAAEPESADHGRLLSRYIRRNKNVLAQVAAGAVKATLGVVTHGLSVLGTDASDLNGVSVNPTVKAGANLESEVARVRGKLADSSIRLIVVVDDVDRMPPERIQALFVALWWVGDLDKVNFLLLFDHERVVDGLARTMFRSADVSDARNSASRFLEKVIQYTFDVPQPTRERLVEVFDDFGRGDLQEIDRALLTAHPTQKYRGMERWQAIRTFVLNELVNTPRAVKRLTWAVKSSWSMRGHIPIDVRDLVAVEALRLFRPTLFRQLEKLASAIDRGLAEFAKLRDTLDPVEFEMLRVLLPVQLASEDSPAQEDEEQVRGRHGFGSARLMSHYLQGVPQPGVDVLYNLEDFFQQRDTVFRKTLKTAAEEGDLTRVQSRVMQRIEQESANGRSVSDFERALRAAADQVLQDVGPTAAAHHAASKVAATLREAADDLS